MANATTSIEYPANGHIYELIGESTTWAGAKKAAEMTVINGLHCHLATITSEGENDFVDMNVLGQDDTWIGGQRATMCADSIDDPSLWGKWVTGEAWVYTNWASDAPDECDDSCLMYTREEEEEEVIEGGGGARATAAQWDEEDCSADLPYLIECEPNADVPALSPGPLSLLSLLFVVSGLWLLKRRYSRIPSS